MISDMPDSAAGVGPLLEGGLIALLGVVDTAWMPSDRIGDERPEAGAASGVAWPGRVGDLRAKLLALANSSRPSSAKMGMSTPFAAGWGT